MAGNEEPPAEPEGDKAEQLKNQFQISNNK
jgi:hypothetical protein